jgi:hypothetical protein
MKRLLGQPKRRFFIFADGEGRACSVLGRGFASTPAPLISESRGECLGQISPSRGEGPKTGHSEGRSNNQKLHMRSTCNYTDCMSKMIQLRHVSDDLHRKLKARAALAGMSLSDYLLNEVRQIAERPTMDEILDRLAKLPPVNPTVTPAEAVRGERDRL